MATTLNTIFKLKRGTAARWAEVNPILETGEPGFVLDENRFKIGDGVTPWNQLPYMGESNIFSGATKEDFPKEGYSWVIYKAENDKKIYQWNSELKIYEELNSNKLIEDDETVLVLYGGSATDNI
jgi:hypothetical protein